MSRTITLDCDGNDITCMKVFDALEYPCNACDIKDCPDRETYNMKYKVKYEDNEGFDEITEFDTEEEAEQAIDEELENCKEWLQSLDYDYGDFGSKTEIWVSGGNQYASWERLWR